MNDLIYLGITAAFFIGSALYVRFCGNCHGADARGGRVGKDLLHELHEGAEEFVEKVREGEGGVDYGARTEYMPSWPSNEISDADIEAIVVYLSGLPGGGGGEGGDDDDDDDDD